MSKRALRRHHKARMIERAKKVTRRWHGHDPETRADADHQALKIADHLKVCSGAWCGCGNPRRWKGFNGPVLTRQETLSFVRFQEELDDLGVQDPK